MIEKALGHRDLKFPIFFLDETGLLNKTDDRFFALGIIKTERPHELQRLMRTIRDKNHFYEEMKWNKMSPIKFGVCQSMIGAFIANRSATFSCTILRKSQLDFAKYFENNLVKVYKSFTVGLLKININPEDEICTVVADDYFYPEGENLELATRAILNDHYNKVVVPCFLQINSKASDLLQLTDLLLGAVIYDLKLREGVIKSCDNLKSKTLTFLHSQLKVKDSFFIDKKGMSQESFLTKKFKVSIFKPTERQKEPEVFDNSDNETKSRP